MKEKPAKHYKKYLKDLIRSVKISIKALDEEMKKPSTVERGKGIAKICNALEIANDSAKYFGLGIPFNKKK